MNLFLEYPKTQHLLSMIDARVKIVVSFVLLALVLSYNGYAFPLFMCFLGIAVCIAMKVPARTLALRFAEPFFIVLILVLIKFFFSGKDILFSQEILGYTVKGYRDGLAEGLLLACRVTGAVSVAAVLGFSTPFAELVSALSWLRIPKGFVEVLILAYRYIFVLIDEALVIYNAQRNRLGYSCLRTGLNSFGTLAGSLTLRAFDHSQNITTSMVQRGYDGNMPSLKHKPFRPLEIALSLLFVALMGFIWKM